MIRPAPANPPLLYVGGESEPGRALAAEYADVFFINGRPLLETMDVIDDLRARPRDGAPLRFGLSAFVIARETEAEAIAELDYLQSLSGRGEPTRDRRRHRPEDPDVQGACRAPSASAPTAAHWPVWSAATTRWSSASRRSMTPASNCSCSSSSPSSPSSTGSRTRSSPTSDKHGAAMTVTHEAVAPRKPFTARPLGGSVDERLARLPEIVASLRHDDPAAERDRVLQYDAVEAIRRTGVLGLRVPAEFGGPGGKVRDVLAAVIQIGRGSSNVAQALRVALRVLRAAAQQPGDAGRTRGVVPACLCRHHRRQCDHRRGGQGPVERRHQGAARHRMECCGSTATSSTPRAPCSPTSSRCRRWTPTVATCRRSFRRTGPGSNCSTTGTDSVSAPPPAAERDSPRSRSLPHEVVTVSDGNTSGTRPRSCSCIWRRWRWASPTRFSTTPSTTCARRPVRPRTRSPTPPTPTRSYCRPSVRSRPPRRRPKPSCWRPPTRSTDW